MTPEGFFLLSACHDKLPMLRRGETGDWVGTFEGHKGAVWSAKLDKTAQRAATGSADFTVKVWNAVSGQAVETFTQKHVVKAVEFSREGNLLWTGGHDKVLRQYDLQQPSAPPMAWPVEQQIRKVVGLPDGRVLTGESDGKIQIWDMKSQQACQTLQLDGPIMDLEVAREGAVVVVAAGKQVRFLDTNAGFAETKCFDMPISFAEEGGASLHPTKDRFIAGGSDTWVRVFDANTGKEVECHKGHHGPVRCLRYAPEGNSYATGSEDGTIRIWQTDLTSAAAATVSMN